MLFEKISKIEIPFSQIATNMGKAPINRIRDEKGDVTEYITEI